VGDEPVADFFEAAAEAEEQATFIEEYGAFLVPGLLQTEAYAREVFRAGEPNPSPAGVDERVASRTARARILDDPNTPMMWVILDEAVLRRPVGGPMVMAEQLQSIAALGRSGRVLVQVLPFSAGAHAVLEGSVVLMSFPDAPDFAYVEGVQTGVLLDDPARVARCRVAYDLARAAALPPRAVPRPHRIGSGGLRA
jgi:hypothetical protein